MSGSLGHDDVLKVARRVLETEAEAVRAFDRRVLDVTGVDDFDPRQLRRTGA